MQTNKHKIGRRLSRLAQCILFAGLSGALQAASLPVPPQIQTPNERSVSFWVKFATLPSVGQPTGLISLTADKDGRLTAAWKAVPTAIQGDLEMVSRDRVAAGEWHHVEARYSLMEMRVAFYLDGRFQWENDYRFVPELAEVRDAGPVGFKGEVRGVRTWDHAVDSERMAVVGGEALSRGVAAARADIARAGECARSSGLKGWCGALAKRCDRLLADDKAGGLASVTVHDLKSLQRDAAHARQVAEAGEAGQYKGCATFVFPTCSQTPVQPYDIPAEAKQTDVARVMMSPDEYETVSWILFAFDRLDVKSLTPGALTGPGGAKIPAENVDLKLVKRWFRDGGAWIMYLCDLRFRVLVPDLLLNDDSLIYVDEERARNFLRLDYPEGSIYADVSNPADGQIPWKPTIPFRDADTIQPFSITAAGRNQQLAATVHVPKGTKPGVYEGAIALKTSAGDVPLKLSIRVLPIDLPAQPSPYMAPDKTYISHLNYFPDVEGYMQKDRVEYVRKAMANIRAHNMNHATHVWRGATQAKMAREAGFIPDHIFGLVDKQTWWTYYPKVPLEELSAEHREMGMRAAINNVKAKIARIRSEIGPDAGKLWTYGFSEQTDFHSLHNVQREMSDTCRRCGISLFAHGMGFENANWAGDVQDMNSSTLLTRKESHIWHAVGAPMINYADPFPSQENPAWFRRKIGLMMYKEEMDGHMLHGFRGGRIPFNEWAEDFGGDGGFRNFSMCYPMQGGSIYELCWEGVREAYDDLRYLTRLTALAMENLEAKDENLLREARKSLLWIESIDGERDDLDAVRVGAISRILALGELKERVCAK